VASTIPTSLARPQTPVSGCREVELSSLEDQGSLVAPPWSSLIEGSHICHAALQRGCLVTAISRTSKASMPRHENLVSERANIFSPEQYRGFLQDASAVVYSAGILFEHDYKALANGKFEVAHVISLLRSRSANPLDTDPKDSTGYNAVNRDGGWDIVSTCN
jgi:hypothetical protein